MSKDITPKDSIVPVYLVSITKEEEVKREAENARYQAEQKNQEKNRESAFGKLKKLGLTDDEIAALSL